jgi:hypothetical protein
MEEDLLSEIRHGSRNGFTVRCAMQCWRLISFPDAGCDIMRLDRVMSLGYAFLSANYQLLPPGTVHEVIQDIQDLFIHLENNDIALEDKKNFRADMNRVAVAGSSSGGHCAYLAAMHCIPKPKAIFAMYAVGGSFFVSYRF